MEQAADREEGPVFLALIKEYEGVIFRSMITSFGLDAVLMHDRRGGDVDTIQTARDKSVTDYADKKNQDAYDNRGDYNSNAYHSHGTYKKVNAENSARRKQGNLEDAYTGKKVDRNAKTDLDHVISAKNIHDDEGRVLAGLDGPELANTDSNLKATGASINRSKKQKEVAEFREYLSERQPERRSRIEALNKKEKLSEKEQKELNKLEQLEAVDHKKLKELDEAARAEYEQKITEAYYTSPKFMKATAVAALNKGARMGVRQAVGFMIMEAWCEVREQFPIMIRKMKDDFSLKQFLLDLADTVKHIFERITKKYKELISTFKDGMLAGMLSSLTTTIINIFFTTAKMIGRILRETYASIIEAVKLLVYNPERLPFGELMQSVSKIIATCVSIVTGSIIQEKVEKMPFIEKMKKAGEGIATFTGAFVSGIMSVTMVYFLDHSEVVKKIVAFANECKDEFDYKVEYYKAVNQKLTVYVAELTGIDYEELEKKMQNMERIRKRLEEAMSDKDLNQNLYAICAEQKLALPYNNLKELDEFMKDENTVLVF